MITLTPAPVRLHDGKRRLFEPANWPTYGVMGALAAIVAVAVLSGRFALDARWATDIGLTLLMAATLACLLRNAGFARVADIVEAFAIFFGLIILAPLCAVVMASTNLPLADDALRRADLSLFGFDRAVVATWLRPGSPAFRTWAWIYHSLTFQPFILLAALFWFGFRRRAWQLLSAWGFALLASLLIFPLFPAFGAPSHVLDFIDVLKDARSGDLRLLGLECLTGIITFPSFHAAAATTLAWGFATFGRYGWPMVALNIAMFASALVVGGHYLIDLPAGALVAIISIRIASALGRRT
jgi:membrane-associated phospholipid phosphatase